MMDRTCTRLIEESPWQIIGHVNRDKTRATDRALRKGAPPDSTVGYSNILFSYEEYAPSSSHRPRETNGITSNCRPGEIADRPYIHPSSQPDLGARWDEDTGGRKQGEGKMSGKNEKKKRDRGKIRYVRKRDRRREAYKRSKNTKESNARYEKRKIGFREEG